MSTGLRMNESTDTSTGSHPIMLANGWKSKPCNLFQWKKPGLKRANCSIRPMACVYAFIFNILHPLSANFADNAGSCIILGYSCMNLETPEILKGILWTLSPPPFNWINTRKILVSGTHLRNMWSLDHNKCVYVKNRWFSSFICLETLAPCPTLAPPSIKFLC